MSAFTRRRIGGAILVALSGALFLSLTSPADAHHPEITATVTCTGLVNYTATAWNGETEASRTNPNIGVWLRRDGGPWVQLPHEPGHQFNAGNEFSFSDSFQLDEPLPGTIKLKVQAQANWGNNAEPGGSRETSTLTVPPCPTTTTSTTESTSTTTSTTVAASTTSLPETTTTTTPTDPTVSTVGSTVPPSTAATPTTPTTVPTTPAELPRTGTDPLLVAFGVASLASGTALFAGSRRRSPDA